jgi:hypothetical protein
MEFFRDVSMDLATYVNAGVVFLDNKSLSVYDKLREFYLENQDKLDNWNKGGGKEQTLFNFILQTNKYKLNLIPLVWNIINPVKTEMIQHNWQVDEPKNDWTNCNPNNPLECNSNHDNTPHFVKYGNITHFTGFPIEHRERIMEWAWGFYE